MPKVTLHRDRRYEKLSMLLAGYKKVCGKTDEQIGKGINRTAPTVCNHRNAPGTYRIDELLDTCRVMGIPIEELRDALRY